MNTVTRLLITVVVYGVTFVLIAFVTFFVVMALAGPHAGILPKWLDPVVLVLGWGVVLGVPALIAAKAWRSMARREPAKPSSSA